MIDPKRLQAHELHELHDQAVEEAAPKIIVTMPPDCGTVLELRHSIVQIMPHYYTGKPAVSVVSSISSLDLLRVNELISLLTEARRLMIERSAK